MKASSDNNDRARGWGWLGSLETGLPFSITDNLMLEPQLQYTGRLSGRITPVM
ncbi:hypothetical protein ECZU32_11460 [Escherichia coli]|nr:hypothetical protein ECZU32_11460 [Escherichia coli]